VYANDSFGEITCSVCAAYASSVILYPRIEKEQIVPLKGGIVTAIGLLFILRIDDFSGYVWRNYMFGMLCSMCFLMACNSALKRIK